MLFGGESSEHDVSISSARNVYAAINDDKYDVLLCFIDRHGKWWLLDDFDDYGDMSNVSQLLPVLGARGFVTIPDNKVIKADVILPILHGRNGEDGSVQGLAQLLHIAAVGCDVTASAISMDKLASKEIVSSHGAKVVPYVVHRLGDAAPEFSQLGMKLGNPLFVKPARAGSSVGVSKVHNPGELTTALELAHTHDKIVLIEQAVAARELEVAVLGTPPNHSVSGIGEIVPGADFYSYDDKYASNSKASVILPADVPVEQTRQLQRLAGTIYQALGCSGLARVDFFLDDDDNIYFNEINTMPGFTNISMYPKLWRQEGVSYQNLIERLIDDALNNATITSKH